MPKFAAKAAKKAEVKAKAMEDKRAKWAEARPVRPSLPPSLLLLSVLELEADEGFCGCGHRDPVWQRRLG